MTRVLVIYTGGTIGMVKDTKTGALSSLDFPSFKKLLPELDRFECEIDFESFGTPIDSSEINIQHWESLISTISSNYDKYTGFVVLHGTDTMAYSASALSFVFQHLDKPIIFTGSQLPVGEIRTDARENIITSIQLASLHVFGKSILKEVAIYFDYQLLRGNRTRKQHTSNFDAFGSPNYPALAHVGVEIVFNHHELLNPSAPLKICKSSFNASEIIGDKIHPNKNFDHLDTIIKCHNIKAIVLEAYGLGNTFSSESLNNIIELCTQKDIMMIIATQCIGGEVRIGKYASGSIFKNPNILSARDMTYEAIMTKLMWILGQDLSFEVCKKTFLTNIAGEINE